MVGRRPRFLSEIREALEFVRDRLEFDANFEQRTRLGDVLTERQMERLFSVLEPEKCFLVGSTASEILSGSTSDPRKRTDILYLGKRSLRVLGALEDSVKFDLVEYGIEEKCQLSCSRRRFVADRKRDPRELNPAPSSLRELNPAPSSLRELNPAPSSLTLAPDSKDLFGSDSRSLRVVRFDAGDKFSSLEESEVEALIKFAVSGSYGRATERTSISPDGKCLQVPWGPEEDFLLGMVGSSAEVPDSFERISEAVAMLTLHEIQDSWVRAAEEDELEALVECFSRLDAVALLARGMFASDHDRLESLVRRNRLLLGQLSTARELGWSFWMSPAQDVPGWPAPSAVVSKTSVDSVPISGFRKDRKSKTYDFLISVSPPDEEGEEDPRRLEVIAESTLKNLLEKVAKTYVCYEKTWKSTNHSVTVEQWLGGVLTDLKKPDKFFSTDSRLARTTLSLRSRNRFEEILEKARERVFGLCERLESGPQLDALETVERKLEEILQDPSEWIVGGTAAVRIVDPEKFEGEPLGEVDVFRGDRGSLSLLERDRLVRRSRSVRKNAAGEVTGGTITSDGLVVRYHLFNTFVWEDTMIAAANIFFLWEDRVVVDLGSNKVLRAAWLLSGRQKLVGPPEVCKLIPFCDHESISRLYRREDGDGFRDTADLEAIYDLFDMQVAARYCAGLLDSECALECFEEMVELSTSTSSSDDEM